MGNGKAIMTRLGNLRKGRHKSKLPGGAQGREGCGTHLPNGRQRVLGSVVAASAVGDGGNAVPGLEHLHSPAGGHRLKAEEAQQEVEAASEEAGIEGTARQQQQHQQQEGEGAHEAPLILPQPHAGARTGTDGRPGPAGLPGQDTEKLGREPKTPAVASTFEWTSAAQWRQPLLPEKESEAQPIRAEDLQSSGRSRCHGNGGGLRLPAGVPKWLWVNLQSGLLSRL